MRSEKNIILVRHSKWLWDNGERKKAKTCLKEAYENHNSWSARYWKNYHATKSSGSVHKRRSKA